MRTIAITKPCVETERKQILSAVGAADKVLFFDSEQEMLESGECANIDVVLGEPDLSAIHAMKKLRWIQMTWAGANKYTSAPDYPEGVVLTSASGAYGHVISEYILAGLLALNKKLLLYRAQLQDGGWSRLADDDTMEGKRVLILGVGDIGEETAKKLKAFGAYPVGICRTPGRTSPFFEEIYTVEQLDAELPMADIVVIALPGTAETAKMFDAERISRMKPSAVLANVGRGFIVDTDALTDALLNGVIKGAVLDVTDPEPLPEQHPLRFMENVILTPHVSGIGWAENMFTRKRILDIFCANIRREQENTPKKNVIDFRKGY